MPQFPETDRIISKQPFYIGGIISSLTHCLSSTGTSTLSTTTAWPTANRGIFVPIVIPERVVITHLGWYNGSIGGSNADCGIYTEDSTLIVSTTPTAQSGTSNWQTVDITNTSVGPGLFYLAISLNGTNRLGIYASAVVIQQAAGLAQQASVGTLPATATMAVVASTVWPVIIALTDTTA